jgi:hypothetical protein
MKITVFFGLLVMVLAFGFIGCSDGNDDGPGTVTYQGTDPASSETYTLKITENTGRAAFVPQRGDNYELTVGMKKSTGAVESFTGGKFTLKPSATGAESFTATVDSSGITAMTETITFDDGTKRSSPVTITPPSSAGTGTNPFKGTWKGTNEGGSVVTYIFYETLFAATSGGLHLEGVYTYNGTSATMTPETLLGEGSPGGNDFAGMMPPGWQPATLTISNGQIVIGGTLVLTKVN